MIGDLSPIGFWGFAAVTFAAGTVKCGWFGDDVTGLFHVMVMVGGIAQVIAGVSDIIRRNPGGGCILTAFGLYWFGEGLNSWPTINGLGAKPYKTPSDYNRMIGFYKLCWSFFCFPMVYVQARNSAMAGVTLLLVCMIFGIHGICGFLSGNTLEGFEKLGGYLMLLAAALAYYLGCNIYVKSCGCKALPFIGPRLFVNDDEKRLLDAAAQAEAAADITNNEEP